MQAAAVGRSSEIDALRCVAMTAVIMMHCRLLPFGWTGVWLFFVISGYVVTRSMLHREAGSRASSRFREFIKRRTVRISPIYYLYILIGIIYTLMIGFHQSALSMLSLFGFFNNAAMIQGNGEFHGWATGHLWTISVEMQFYAIYGFALCFLSRAAILRLLIVFIFASPIARCVASLWLTQNNWAAEPAAYAIYAGPFLHFDSFTMGGLLALYADRRSIADICRPLFVAGALAVVLFASFYIFINYALLDRHGLSALRNILSGILIGQYREIFLYSVVALLSAGCVALAVARDPWLIWFAKYRPLQWIGTISYGGYVYHACVLGYVDLLLSTVLASQTAAPVRHVLMFVIAYPVTLLVAWLSYRFLEQPLIRHFSGKARIMAGGRAARRHGPLGESAD